MRRPRERSSSVALLVAALVVASVHTAEAQSALLARGRERYERAGEARRAADVLEARRFAITLEWRRRRHEREAIARDLRRAEENLRRLAHDDYVAAADEFAANLQPDAGAIDRFAFAETLYRLGRPEDAVQQLIAVRDESRDPALRARSAWLAVAAIEASLLQATGAGRLDPCTAVRAGLATSTVAHAIEGRAPNATPRLDECQWAPAQLPPTRPETYRTIPIPEAVRALMNARSAYSALVPEALDTDAVLAPVHSRTVTQPERNAPLHDVYLYQNANTLLRFGHVAEAETQLRELLRRCPPEGPAQGAALSDLLNLLRTQSRNDDLDAILRDSADTASGCAARRPVDPLHHRFAAIRRMNPEGHGASPDSSVRVAQALEAIVRDYPNHPVALPALMMAAVYYYQAGRLEDANRVATRVADADHLELLAADPFAQSIDEAPSEFPPIDRRLVVGQALILVGHLAERQLDFERAIGAYTRVVDDPRLQGVRDFDSSARFNAAVSVAYLEEVLGRWRAARLHWLRALSLSDPRDRPASLASLANNAFRRGRWSESLGWLRRFDAAVVHEAQAFSMERLVASSLRVEVYRRLHDRAGMLHAERSWQERCRGANEWSRRWCVSADAVSRIPGVEWEISRRPALTE